MEININNNPNAGNNDLNSPNSPKSTKSWWIWVFLLLVLALAVWMLISSLQNKQGDQKQEQTQNQPVDKQVSTKEQQKSALAKHDTYNFFTLNLTQSKETVGLPESLKHFIIGEQTNLSAYSITEENGRKGYKFEYTATGDLPGIYFALQKVSNSSVTGYNLANSARAEEVATMSFTSKEWKVSIELEKIGGADTLVKVIALD